MLPLTHPLQSLKRLGVLALALMLGFGVAFGLLSWRSVRNDSIRNLETIIQLTERALDQQFSLADAGLKALSSELLAAYSAGQMAEVQRLLSRYQSVHPEALSVTLIRPDGQMLATSGTERVTGLPSLKDDAAFQDLIHALKPQTLVEFSRPYQGARTRRWQFGVVHVIRTGDGTSGGAPAGLLTLGMPVTMLEALWRDVPVIEGVSFGLLRDDGYLISRYPIPEALPLDVVYGQPRAGTLRNHLKGHGYPTRGIVEGPSAINGEDLTIVFKRLEHFPVTLFAATPSTQLFQAWGQRVGVPYLLLALLLAGGLQAYRTNLKKQQAWDADRRAAEETLSASEQDQRFLIDHLMAGLVVHDAAGAVIRCNPKACALLGLTLDQLQGHADRDPAWQFLREDGSVMPRVEYPVTRVLATDQAVQDTVVGVVRAHLAQPVWLICRADPDLKSDGTLHRVVVTFVDITARRQVEFNLERSESQFKSLFEHTLDGVLLGTPDGNILRANPAACAMLGCDEDTLRKLGRAGLLDETDPRLRALAAERAETGHVRAELRMRRFNGELFDVELASSRYAGRDGEPYSNVVFRDITKRKEAEENIYRLAYFDALTGLPNRRLLLDRTTLALAAAHRSHQRGALIFLDLDNFKHINDARGHAVGDSLLLQVAQRLSHLLRAEDTVARLGGDEFVVLVTDLGPDLEGSARTAMAIAEKVRKVLDSPYEIEGAVYSSTGSIGITLFPKCQEGVDDLLREADTAMYRAKSGGRNKIAFFEADMQTEVEERLALEQDLKDALARGQMAAYVQPQYDTGGQVVGGELLLRWNHPVRGQVSPARFIPIAEESGAILPIGDWVVLQACQALARLAGKGLALSLSVNVSPRQFRQDDFVGRVRDVLAQTQAPAGQLLFEVTEGLLIDNWEDTSSRMAELGNMGIRFSIDDFGTGYSSLAYLKKLPLYELKIDKSFVQDTPDDANDTAIVQSIIAVAKHLKLKVVAEGVETQAQADFLAANQCDGLQGYLFARPRPLQDWLADLLA